MGVFTKNDIKAGYLLRARTASDDLVNLTVSVGSDGELGCCNPGKQWCPVDAFSENLDQPTGRDRLCVIEVYGPTSNMRLLDNDTAERELLWQRKLDAKKLTVAQIAQKLGYPVEIVEG